MKGSHNTIGKRKRAVARVFLKPGSGVISVNGKTFDEYFGREELRMVARQSLEVAGQLDKVDVKINVQGGGTAGQAGAVRHGIARALVDMNEEFKPALRAEGLLTRDAREVERKKYGLHKARKRPQFSKR